MKTTVKLALLVAAAGVILSLVPASATGHADTYDVKVVSEVQWHSTLRYWDAGEPAITGVEPSPVVNFGAMFDNALFFGKGDAKDVVFELRARSGSFTQTVVQSTGEGSRFGSQEEISIVFVRVPPGQYDITVSIPGEDSSLSKSKTIQTTVGS